jgi:hypothetical protein
VMLQVRHRRIAWQSLWCFAWIPRRGCGRFPWHCRIAVALEFCGSFLWGVCVCVCMKGEDWIATPSAGYRGLGKGGKQPKIHFSTSWTLHLPRAAP